jgi:hypothetical protein
MSPSSYTYLVAPGIALLLCSSVRFTFVSHSSLLLHESNLSHFFEKEKERALYLILLFVSAANTKKRYDINGTKSGTRGREESTGGGGSKFDHYDFKHRF